MPCIPKSRRPRKRCTTDRVGPLADFCQTAGRSENAVHHDAAGPVGVFPTFVGVVVRLIQFLEADGESGRCDLPASFVLPSMSDAPA